MKRIVIAAPHSGSGKTTVCMALLRAWTARCLRVQPFKVGPDYIDTAYHARICRRDAINLDGFLMDETSTRQLVCEYGAGADLSVIEGVMGLYDGLGGTTEASTAQIASWIGAPIVVVLDPRGMAATAAAILTGLRDFGKAEIRGVIFNKIRSERHYETLRTAVEAAGFACLGYLPAEEGLSIESRQLGILPESELLDADRKIARLGELAEAFIDLAALEAIAASAPPLDEAPLALEPICGGERVRIAVARDKAFNFYYADNLRILEKLGAQLVDFSPMADKALPDCEGVYIGGGFPEVFAGALAANESMKQSVRAAFERAVPIFAECGGCMYLMEGLEIDGETHAMCGIFSGVAKQGKRLSRHFGYVESELLANAPIGPKGRRFRHHEFHHSEIDTPLPPALRTKKAATGESWEGGMALGLCFGSYAHVAFRGEMRLACHFVECCRAFKRDKNPRNA